MKWEAIAEHLPLPSPPVLDARRLRTEPEVLRAGLVRKGADLGELERAVGLDAERRALAERRDDARGRVNELSKQVGQRKRAGDEAGAADLASESRRLGEETAALEAQVAESEAALRDLLLRIPNLPADDVVDGAGPDDNVVRRQEGPDPDSYAEHQRVPHWETATDLGLLDLERAAKISGSMFPLYRGAGARLVRALTSWALDHHVEAGFEEIRPPHLVRTDTLVATGQLPKFADDAYHLERDDLWAIPTAEVPLTSMRRDEILPEAELPLRLTAATPCYRREAGAAGRDTRGLLRSHEFDKVEILAICTPDQAPAAHQELLDRSEALLIELGLTYRLLDICTGDLGQSHARQFDWEVWSPGVGQWLEVSSVSWFSDYQARRANIRYRRTEDRKVDVAHTLNGSALAWPRMWAALVEVGRQPDGSVELPEVLSPYLGGRTTIPVP